MADSLPDTVLTSSTTEEFKVTLAEGGWWYDEGELVSDRDIYRTLGGTPRSFLTEQQADAYAAELVPKLAPLNQGRPPKHASASQGIYEVQVLQAASLPVGFPAARPHYE